MAAKEPRTVSHFELHLNGREAVGVFRECTGMDSETEVTEHKAVDAHGNPFVRKIPGATKWSNITLKRGVDSDMQLWQWRDEVVKKGPDGARVDGLITLKDYDG